MKSKKDLIIPFDWEGRRPIYLDRFFYLPKQFDHHESWGRLDWADERIFGNQKPVHIELCSGNGQWIGDRAKENPEINWVAVELRFDRARKIWLKGHRENIPNLYTVCAEGRTFLRYYTPVKSVAQSFVNFPDPWPKLRHAKHRIVQKPFLDALSTTLADGAVATFATDDVPYRDQMIQELSGAQPWLPILPQPHFHTDWSAYGDSYFANLWLEKGRTIYYVQYRNG